MHKNGFDTPNKEKQVSKGTSSSLIANSHIYLSSSGSLVLCFFLSFVLLFVKYSVLPELHSGKDEDFH